MPDDSVGFLYKESKKHNCVITKKEDNKYYFEITSDSQQAFKSKPVTINCLPICNTDDGDKDLEQIPKEICFENVIFADKGKDSTSTQDLFTDDSTDDLPLNENEIQITYLKEIKGELKPFKIFLIVDNYQVLIGTDNFDDKSLINKSKLLTFIMMKSYNDNLDNLKKRYLLLINPNGGKGEAQKRFINYIKPILDAAQLKYEVKETEYHYHTLDIIKDLNLDDYDVIVCCSGDGIPHEVINGIYKRKDRIELFERLIITQLPCGSGNAFSLTCHKTLKPSFATLSMLKSPIIKMDLMGINQGKGDKSKYSLSFLSQTYGMIADADIGTEWMRRVGPSRFELGVGYKVLTGSRYPCDIYVKYKAETIDEVVTHWNDNLNNEYESTINSSIFETKLPTLDESIPEDWTKIKDTHALSVFYTGKMPYIAKDTQFFPAALPNDGTMDLLIMHSHTNFLSKVGILLNLDSGKQMFHNDVIYGKITAYRLVPFKNNYISVDGESFPLEPIQGEILPKVLNVISKDGKYLETILHKQ